MKSTTFATAALFAASSATAATTCPGINILEACLETTQGYLTLCPTTTDYQCLCDKWTAIVRYVFLQLVKEPKGIRH